MAVKASDIITVAKREVGTKATNYRKCKYNTWYYGTVVSGSGYDWCEVFVQWVFNQAGASSLLYTKTANCGYAAKAFQDRGRLKLSGFKRGEDFLWFSDYNNPGKIEMQSFAVYSYPYTSPDNFSKEYFIQKRDSFMMMNIPGGEPDSYIQTDAGTVTTTDVAYNGKYMCVARGLWYMKNDDMFGGGPFVSHSIVDEENGRMIVVEAFVYAPNKKKGGFMRKLEAALHTLKLPVDLAAVNAQPAEEKK
jgi:hypothetical protein